MKKIYTIILSSILSTCLFSQYAKAEVSFGGYSFDSPTVRTKTKIATESDNPAYVNDIGENADSVEKQYFDQVRYFADQVFPNTIMLMSQQSDESSCVEKMNDFATHIQTKFSRDGFKTMTNYSNYEKTFTDIFKGEFKDGQQSYSFFVGCKVNGGEYLISQMSKR